MKSFDILFNSSPTSGHICAVCCCGCPRDDLLDRALQHGIYSWRQRCQGDTVAGVTVCFVQMVVVYWWISQKPASISLEFCNVSDRACTFLYHFRWEEVNLMLPRFPPKLRFLRDFVPPRHPHHLYCRCTWVPHKTETEKSIIVKQSLDVKHDAIA